MKIRPAESEVPDYLVHISDQNRSLDEVAANYDDPGEITTLFTGWGWQGNVTRAYQMPDEVYPEPWQVNGIYVSIHAYDSPESAAAALDFSVTDQAASTSAAEVSTTALGDYFRALYGRMDYGNEITLLVQKGNLLIRLSAAQLEGDPTEVAVGIMQGILTRAG